MADLLSPHYLGVPTQGFIHSAQEPAGTLCWTGPYLASEAYSALVPFLLLVPMPPTQVCGSSHRSFLLFKQAGCVP